MKLALAAIPAAIATYLLHLTAYTQLHWFTGRWWQTVPFLVGWALLLIAARQTPKNHFLTVASAPAILTLWELAMYVLNTMFYAKTLLFMFPIPEALALIVLTVKTVGELRKRPASDPSAARDHAVRHRHPRPL